MDDTLASMTPSAQLAPVHVLSDVQPPASDPAPDRAVRGAAQQLAQVKEAAARVQGTPGPLRR
eukprot:1058660-Pleurochrysis_carterae.AAC.1